MGSMYTENDVKAAIDAYDAAIAKADRDRAVFFAKATESGTQQTTLIAASGYSREKVRQITRKGQEILAGGQP